MSQRLHSLSDRTEPRSGQTINVLHPLAPRFCWVLSEAAGNVVNDAVGGFISSPVSTGDLRWVDGNYGSAANFVAANSQSISLASSSLLVPSLLVTKNNAPFTIALSFRTTDTGTTFLCPYSEGDSTGHTGYLFTFRINETAAGRLRISLTDGSATSITATIFLGGSSIPTNGS